MVKQSSQGTCELCKKPFSKRSMARHLATCVVAHESADTGNAAPGKLYHVVVEGKHQPAYWLHLEVPATATLGDLDAFLRRIWLECCGHLSAFRRKVKRSARNMWASVTSVDDDDWKAPGELSMEQHVGAVFRKGLVLDYDYDFGSTTELSVAVVAEREGIVTKPRTVRLLARNDAPAIPCGACGQAAATIIDAENAYDGSGWLCKSCAKRNEVDLEMSLPVVNSPRTGVCGYTGD